MTAMKSGTTATRVNVYMEHGVQERLDMLVQYHARELKKRYQVSRSSFIKMIVVDAYRKMREEVQEKTGRDLTKKQKGVM